MTANCIRKWIRSRSIAGVNVERGWSPGVSSPVRCPGHSRPEQTNDNGWVILSDKLEDGSRRINTEPIANPDDLLRRVQVGLARIDPECHELLLAWQRSDKTSSDTEVTDGRIPSRGAIPT